MNNKRHERNLSLSIFALLLILIILVYTTNKQNDEIYVMNENKTFYTANIERLDAYSSELQAELKQTESKIVDFDAKMTWAAENRAVVQEAIRKLEGSK